MYEDGMLILDQNYVFRILWLQCSKIFSMISPTESMGILTVWLLVTWLKRVRCYRSRCCNQVSSSGIAAPNTVNICYNNILRSYTDFPLKRFIEDLVTCGQEPLCVALYKEWNTGGTRVHKTCVAHGPLTRYVILRVPHAPGIPGTFSPPPISKETASYAGMHHNTCVTHVPWCMSGSLTRQVAEKTFPAFPVHAQPTISCIWQEAHGAFPSTHCGRDKWPLFHKQHF